MSSLCDVISNVFIGFLLVLLVVLFVMMARDMMELFHIDTKGIFKRVVTFIKAIYKMETR